MIKLVICGAAGRMGQTIYSLAQTDADLSVVGLIEAPGSKFDGKTMNGLPVRSDIRTAAKEADVIIDFTAPAATLHNATAMAETRKALVVGTTGFTETDKAQFLKTVKSIPVVFSPNMSLGANVMFDAVERLARILSDYDAEITEIHHNLKKDAPSGTAQRLADSVARGRGPSAHFNYGRHGLVGARKPGEIGVHALRGGDVVGDHTVFFLGRGERIEISHRVASREALALGALRAAKWIMGKKPGLYDMSDVLGLRK